MSLIEEVREDVDSLQETWDAFDKVVAESISLMEDYEKPGAVLQVACMGMIAHATQILAKAVLVIAEKESK